MASMAASIEPWMSAACAARCTGGGAADPRSVPGVLVSRPVRPRPGGRGGGSAALAWICETRLSVTPRPSPICAKRQPVARSSGRGRHAPAAGRRFTAAASTSRVSTCSSTPAGPSARSASTSPRRRGLVERHEARGRDLAEGDLELLDREAGRGGQLRVGRDPLQAGLDVLVGAPRWRGPWPAPTAAPSRPPAARRRWRHGSGPWRSSRTGAPRSASNRSMASSSPTMPALTRSARSTLEGSPTATRAATYFTSGV